MLDRGLRGLAGVVLLVFAFAGNAAVLANPIAYWSAILVGAVLLVTAVVGFCPIYRMVGLRTCREC